MPEWYDVRKTSTLLAWKMEGGHEPRNVGGLEKLERAIKQILPYNLQKGTNPVYILSLDQWDPFQTFELQICNCAVLSQLLLVCYIKETITITIPNFPLKYNWMLWFFSIESNLFSGHLGMVIERKPGSNESSLTLHHLCYSLTNLHTLNCLLIIIYKY